MPPIDQFQAEPGVEDEEEVLRIFRQLGLPGHLRQRVELPPLLIGSDERSQIGFKVDYLRFRYLSNLYIGIDKACWDSKFTYAKSIPLFWLTIGMPDYIPSQPRLLCASGPLK